MKYNNFDREYYVMSIDLNTNRPLLAWGKGDFSHFLNSTPIDESTLHLPLPILFCRPYPNIYGMKDFMMMGGLFVGSGRLKSFFGRLNLYGVQFIPIVMITDSMDRISGYYAIHFWNGLSAVDRNNYSGCEPNHFGRIQKLSRFSLDAGILSTIPLRLRLIFMLNESVILIIVHESIREKMVKSELTGFDFKRVNEYLN